MAGQSVVLASIKRRDIAWVDAATLFVWAGVHAVCVYLLLKLETDLSRSYANKGPAALSAFVGLLALNTALYTSLWASQRVQRHKRQTWQQQEQEQQQPEEVRSVSPGGSTGLISLLPRKAAAAAGGADIRNSGQASPRPKAPAARPSPGRSQPAATAPHHQSQDLCNACGGAPAPLRAHHCRRCQCCVPAQDHHCLWIGTCVGRHNHRRFLLFLLSQVSLAVYGLHHTLTAMRRGGQQAWGWQHLVGGTLAFFLLACTMLIGGLLAFHCYLVATNQTTREVVNRQAVPYLQGFPLEVSPFDAGMLVNLWNFVFDLRAYDTPQVCMVDGVMRLNVEAIASSANPRNGFGLLGVLCDNDCYSCC